MTWKEVVQLAIDRFEGQDFTKRDLTAMVKKLVEEEIPFMEYRQSDVTKALNTIQKEGGVDVYTGRKEREHAYPLSDVYISAGKQKTTKYRELTDKLEGLHDRTDFEARYDFKSRIDAGYNDGGTYDLTVLNKVLFDIMERNYINDPVEYPKYLAKHENEISLLIQDKIYQQRYLDNTYGAESAFYYYRELARILNWGIGSPEMDLARDSIRLIKGWVDERVEGFTWRESNFYRKRKTKSQYRKSKK